MTDTNFPNPHGDDPLEDDMPDPGRSGYEGTMGAASVTPAVTQRKPRSSKGMALIVVPVLLIGAFVWAATRGHRGDATTVTTQAHTTDSLVTAMPDTARAHSAPSSAPIVNDTVVAPSNVIEPISPDVAASAVPVVGQPGGAQGGVNPGTVRPGTTAPSPDATTPGGVTPDANAYAGSPLPESAGPQPDVTGASGNNAAAAASADALAREAQAARDARKQARLAAITAEEARLRSHPTLMVQAQQTTPGAAPAPDRFGTAGIVGPVVGGGSVSAPDATAMAKQIVPGTRVHATTVSQYRSDTPGANTIEVKLTEPLRVNGQVMLPAGTRAFGQVTAQVPMPGREARASISFDVFVTPQNQVIRGLRGTAIDPKTLATSVGAVADNHYTQRFGRALLSGGLDYLLTQNSTQPISVFQQPSARDQAIADERRRFGAIINGSTGDENSFTASVRIDPGTSLLIQFGI